MKYLNFKSEYNRFPIIDIKKYDEGIYKGYKNIFERIKQTTSNTIIMECYPGVRYNEIKTLIDLFEADVYFVDEYAKSGVEITEMIQEKLTDDRVFAYLSHIDILDFYDKEKVMELQNKIDPNKLQIFYGFGASKIVDGTVIYFDMARWEIQQRFRTQELTNWRMDNYDLDILKKYKRAYFFEWRTADMIKKDIYDSIDFYIDTNQSDNPKMITGNTFKNAIAHTITTPFRLVPYFDPGVWGGQWMKEACNLDPNKENYAWSFDGVPEENAIYLGFGDDYIETPSINVVFFQSIPLLGRKLYNRFGAEYPIRFDFLDTIEGGNLSLQVHPLQSYIKEQFNMDYTQDESYYMLEALEDASVYLGVKEGINPQEMIDELKVAETGERPFDADKFINKFPAKKHDHFLIPAGTVHCSGSNSMVLEISATPYIFTFKLWDWGRLGLDGLPRPVHIDHGSKVIQFNRDTKWVKENLVDQVKVIYEDEDLLVEKTGLHDLEFIETLRYTSSKEFVIDTDDSVNQLNLVEGRKIIVSSMNGEFEDFVVNYAETFIVPECIKTYKVKPYYENETIMLLRAIVK